MRSPCTYLRVFVFVLFYLCCLHTLPISNPFRALQLCSLAIQSLGATCTAALLDHCSRALHSPLHSSLVATRHPPPAMNKPTRFADVPPIDTVRHNDRHTLRHRGDCDHWSASATLTVARGGRSLSTSAVAAETVQHREKRMRTQLQQCALLLLLLLLLLAAPSPHVSVAAFDLTRTVWPSPPCAHRCVCAECVEQRQRSGATDTDGIGRHSGPHRPAALAVPHARGVRR